MRGRVVWLQDSLTHGLQWFKANVDNQLEADLQDFAQECEDYMKANAPWEDRTGDARDGLSGTYYHRGDVHGVLLAHGVDYGKWLEIRWGGRFAIIKPTLEVKGPELKAKTSGLLDRTNYQGFG